MTEPNTYRAIDQALLDTFLDIRPSLVSLARSYVSDIGLAEDIVQDAITRVLEMASSTQIKSPKAYLKTAVRNRAINYLSRAEKKHVVSVDNFVVLNVSDNRPSHDQRLEDREKLSALLEAMETLPDQCKRVLLLRKVHGLSLKDTADVLGIAISTVQKHLTKALARCAVYLQEQGLD